MYNNGIVLYKALLLQCEKDFDLMINVRLSRDCYPKFQPKTWSICNSCSCKERCKQTAQKSVGSFHHTKRQNYLKGTCKSCAKPKKV